MKYIITKSWSSKLVNIFISGASSGLGLNMYRALCLKNVQITVLGRSPPKNLRKKDTFLQLDFSKKVLFKLKSKKKMSKVIFISNAGIIDPIMPVSEIDVKLLRYNNNVNFISPYVITSELARVTKKKKIPFHIMNISSGAANRAVAGWSAYCSSKAAIKIALDCIVLENKHITLEHINPGVLDTKMQQQIRLSKTEVASDNQYFINLYNKGLLKKPETVATDIMDKLDRHIK